MARERHFGDVAPHTHAPNPKDERARDVGLWLTVIGAAALTFAIGRATAPNNTDCCNRLVVRDLELINCESQRMWQGAINGAGSQQGQLGG